MEESDEKLTKIKVAVLGDSGAGKSCLIAVFSAIKNNRTENFSEILEDSAMTVGNYYLSLAFQTLT